MTKHLAPKVYISDAPGDLDLEFKFTAWRSEDLGDGFLLKIELRHAAIITGPWSSLKPGKERIFHCYVDFAEAIGRLNEGKCAGENLALLNGFYWFFYGGLRLTVRRKP